MTERKWTPGPWNVDPEHGADVQASGSEVCLVWQKEYIGVEFTASGNITASPEECAANARLIAACPTMYEALWQAYDAHVPFEDDERPDWWIAVCDALAKAEGDR